MTLFDAAGEIGGQFNLAKRIPGKEEFHETLRYYARQLTLLGVYLQLGRRIVANELIAGRFDEIVLATGVVPRVPTIAGIDHCKDGVLCGVIRGGHEVGRSVAIVGAGGIGFDVAEYLSHGPGPSPSIDPGAFMAEWGIDATLGRARRASSRVWYTSKRVHGRSSCCNEEASKPGEGLGKTTGWIHRTALRRRGVEMIAGVACERIDDEGLHVRTADGPRTFSVDSIVICAGQEPLRELQQPLLQAGLRPHLIGGADVAVELDAKRAIDQGSRLAARL